MLPGNGRHRRPRQAPAILVAAGVTGSAIALPLLAAASANAADGTTWDKVAQCESGGSWSANTGNGFYGGLQLTQDTWDKYGGDAYAATPDEASRSQQIAVAEKILAREGTVHWATCALLSGLSSHSGSVHVDTGVSQGDDSSGSSHSHSSHSSDGQGSSDSGILSGLLGSPDSSASNGGDSGSSRGDEQSDSPSPSTDPGATQGSDDSGKSDKSASPGSDAAHGGVGSSTTPEPHASDNAWQTGGTWSLVDTGALGGGRHRGGSADESKENGANGAAARHAYTVREGDSLASIADSLDVHGGWRALYDANKKVIGSDPNDISAGQILHVSGKTGEK